MCPSNPDAVFTNRRESSTMNRINDSSMTRTWRCFTSGCQPTGVAPGLVTWSSTSARKRNQLREFPIFSELSKPSHSVSSCPRLVGLDAAWRGAAALPERHHSQCGEAFMNRRHPDFRMPPLVLAGLFFVQLASVAHLPNAWHIWGSGRGSGMGRMNFHSATFAVSGNIGWRRSASGARRLDSSGRMASMKLQHVSL